MNDKETYLRILNEFSFRRTNATELFIDLFDDCFLSNGLRDLKVITPGIKPVDMRDELKKACIWLCKDVDKINNLTNIGSYESLDFLMRQILCNLVDKVCKRDSTELNRSIYSEWGIRETSSENGKTDVRVINKKCFDYCANNIKMTSGEAKKELMDDLIVKMRNHNKYELVYTTYITYLKKYQFVNYDFIFQNNILRLYEYTYAILQYAILTI